MSQSAVTTALPEETAQEVRTVASLVSLLALGLLDNQILSPILREIATSLDVSVRSVGMTVSGYAIAAAVAALIVGPLSDGRGRKEFLVAAGVVFAIGSAGAYAGPSFLWFALARVGSGAAAGVISALSVAAIADRVPYERRGRAMGWVAAAYFAAPSLGVYAATMVAGRFGWRTNYLVLSLFALSLALLIRSWFSEETAKRKQSRPGLRRYFVFFRTASIAAGAVSAFFISGGLTGFVLYLGAFLGDAYGLTVTEVGLVFLLSGSAGVVGALGAGRLADGVGKRTVALAGSLALVFLLVVVPFVTAPLLYVVLGLVGLAGASRVAPLQSIVTELVGREERGAYVALRNTLSQLGIATAAAVGGLLYSRGFEWICWFTAGLSFVAFSLLFVLREPVTAEET